MAETISLRCVMMLRGGGLLGWTAMLFCLFWAQVGHAGKGIDLVYGPLSVYEGKWQVTRTVPAQTGKPDLLQNECSRIGNYYACQQTVNGTPSALLVFVPLGQTGQNTPHYATQSVMPDGRAGGRGELTIDGDRWTFSGSWNPGGKTIYTRTVNVFSGKNRIHFEQSESTDKAIWTVKGSGDEVRTGTSK